MKSHPRIVHVVVAGEMGGAERMALDLARHAKGAGAEASVALVTSSDQVAEIFAKSGVRVHRGPPARENPVSYLWSALGPSHVSWLASVMKSERATVAHLHTFASQVMGTRAAQRAGAAVLRTEHSSRVYTTPSCWPFSRWSLARTHAIVAISDYIRRTISTKAPEVQARLRVVGNGVDTSRFVPASRSRTLDRPFSFALVARLEPRKGIDLALASLAQVPGATLDIVGDGPERARLERLTSSLSLGARVRFHGFLDDPRPVMHAADAALSSSTDEGLGLGLLECMATGLPVIAVPAGGIPEIVLEGATGWLSSERTATALAASMRAAMSDVGRARDVGASARRFVERCHSVRSMVDAYGEIYAALHRARRSENVTGLKVLGHAEG
jgi:glycosyltransferase involved in cell wall biosynthesis